MTSSRKSGKETVIFIKHGVVAKRNFLRGLCPFELLFSSSIADLVS